MFDVYSLTYLLISFFCPQYNILNVILSHFLEEQILVSKTPEYGESSSHKAYIQRDSLPAVVTLLAGHRQITSLGP